MSKETGSCPVIVTERPVQNLKHSAFFCTQSKAQRSHKFPFSDANQTQKTALLGV